MWDSFGAFFDTFLGKAAVVMAILAILALFGLAARRKPVFTVRSMTRTAICIALSVALSFVTPYTMPQGGSVTLCSMFFITLAGYWFGPAAGIIAGVTRGLLDLTLRPYVVHPVQLLLDYFFGFGILGISGFFRNIKIGHGWRPVKIKRLPAGCNSGPRLFLHNLFLAVRHFISDMGLQFGFYLGFAAAVFGRFLMSTLSGVVFFASSAPVGENVVWYSVAYNGSYIFAEMFITLVIMCIPAFRKAIVRMKAAV